VTEKSPTGKQLDALVAIRAGKVTMRNQGYGAYRIGGPVQPTVVGRCTSLRWAKWPKGACAEQTCEITEAGIAVLIAAGRCD
jgi:hypothetical protein